LAGFNNFNDRWPSISFQSAVISDGLAKSKELASFRFFEIPSATISDNSVQPVGQP
jgi:hypothetical protein